MGRPNRKAPVKVAPGRDSVCTTFNLFFDKSSNSGFPTNSLVKNVHSSSSSTGQPALHCWLHCATACRLLGCAGSMRAGGLAGVGDLGTMRVTEAVSGENRHLGRLIGPPVFHLPAHLRTREPPEPSFHAIFFGAGDTQTRQTARQRSSLPICPLDNGQIRVPSEIGVVCL